MTGEEMQEKDKQEERRHQIWLLQYQHQHEDMSAMFQSTLEAGTIALKCAFLMNGGATIALLTLFGSLTKDKPIWATDYALSNASWALYSFALGTGFAAVSAALKYFTQAVYTDGTGKRMTPGIIDSQEEYDDYQNNFKEGAELIKSGNRINWFVIGAAYISYWLFFLGIGMFARTFLLFE